MMIQPILENAIWHGILHLKEKGHLRLQIDRKSDTLLNIKVEDNGVGITDIFIGKNLLKQPDDTQLLCIVIQRLKILAESSGQELFFRYNHLHPDKDNKGTVANYILPALFQKNL
jgi:sensor histidine kinase YesM